MKKIISYSLYNSIPKNTINAIINCLLAPKIYPDWVVRFYLDDTVPKPIVDILRTFDYVEIVEMPRGTGSERMCWRFLPAADYNAVMISRDCDSWISSREKVCVDAWLASDKNFSIIRDHCYHTDPKVKIMGGVWGSRNGIIPKMAEEIDTFVNSGKTYDQGFLATVIYPNILHTVMVHYGDPQYDNQGNRTFGGAHNDGGVPIPPYQENDEPIPGLSFRRVNKLNEFFCAHCKKHHEVFIGGIMEHIPEDAMQVVRAYAASKGVDVTGCPGF
tara:strand:+ start:18636 stop:19454 length:819 start_codon:yes stop_codon:yes gene_type:complete